MCSTWNSVSKLEEWQILLFDPQMGTLDTFIERITFIHTSKEKVYVRVMLVADIIVVNIYVLVRSTLNEYG